MYIALVFMLSFATALTPDPVQNLTVAADTHKASVTLKWDPPANAEDVTVYDICYRQSNNWQLTTVNVPASSVLLTLKDGLIPRVTYDFEVRARNAECVGEWSGVSKHTGTFSQCLVL